MAQVINFEGTQHSFPDDFTEAEISAALAASSQPAPTQEQVDAYVPIPGVQKPELAPPAPKKATPIVMQAGYPHRRPPAPLPDASAETPPPIDANNIFGLTSTDTSSPNVDAESKLAFFNDTLNKIFPDPVPTVAKAVRDTLVGGTSGVFDLIGQDDTGRSIERMVPEIVPQGPAATASNVGADVIRYGAPALVGGLKAAQVGQQLVKNSGPMIQSFVKYLSGLTGGGLSDMVVTNPSKDVSIGEVVQELAPSSFPSLPTAPSPDDSRLMKRLKIGAETAAIQPVADVAMQTGRAVKGVGKFIKKGVQDYRKLSPENLRQAAADHIQSKVKATGAEPEAVAKEIEQTVKEAPEYANLTSGQASNNPAIQSLDQGNRTAQTVYSKDGMEVVHPSDTMAGRQKDQINAVDQEVADLANQANPDRAQQTVAAKKAIQEDIDERIAVAQKSVDDTADEVAAVEAKVEHQTEQKAQLAAKKPDANEKLGDTLEHTVTAKEKDTGFSGLDEQKNTKFDVDPGNKIQRHSNNMAKAWKNANKGDTSGERDSVDLVRSKLGKHSLEMLDSLKAGGKVGFNDVQSLRNNISAALKDESVIADGIAKQRLGELKKSVNHEFELLAKQDGGKHVKEAQAASDAVDFFQNTFAPILRDGSGAKFAKAIKKHANSGKEVQRFFKRDAVGQEAADEAIRLRKFTEQAENPAQARRDVRNYIMADMATTTKNLNKGAIDEYINTHSSLLKEFPEAKGVLERLSRNVDATADELVAAKKAFKDASDAMKITDKQIQRSRAQRFLDSENVADVAKAALRSDAPEAEITEMLRMAARDKTGEAKKGVEQAVSDAMYDLVTSANRSADDALTNFRTSLNNMDTLMEKQSVQKALVRTHGKEAVDAMNEVRKTLNLHARKISTAGSNTAQNIAADQAVSGEALRKIFAAYWGITKGRGVFTISRWVSDAIRGDTDVALSKILLEMSTDPKKAVEALRMSKPIKVKSKAQQAMDESYERDKTTKRMKTFLANNYPELVTDEKDKKKE